MKKLIVAALFLALVSTVAYAVYPAGQTVRLTQSTPVLTSGYTQLLASTTKNISQVQVLNSTTQAVQIALGAAGSEVVQMTVPSTGAQSGLQTYNISIPAGNRVAVIALGASTGTTGELDFNFLSQP